MTRDAGRPASSLPADLVLSALLAQHVADAIKTHASHLRSSGSSVPAEYAELVRFFAGHGLAGRSVGVTGAHSVSILDSAAASGEPRSMSSVLDYRASAEHLGISCSTLKRRIAAGDLVPIRHGRIARFRVADLDVFLDERKGA